MTLPRRALLAGGGAAALALPAWAEVRTPADLVVETTLGRIRGYEREGIRSFKGVPYGAAERFKAPVSAQPWAGVRSCLTWGLGSPQAPRDLSSDGAAFLMPLAAGGFGEDCLNLNVWTPGLEGRRPVMVWLHGGNFSTGSAWMWQATDGENLSRFGDVVVVSVNHRLNALGYLDMEAIGGGSEYAGAVNAGMLDLVVALEWVRDNIGRFGGDPGNVMIFGQSGGGLKCTTLMAMPSARGLFHRACAMSGSQTRLFRPEHGAALARELLKETGGSANDLATMPVDRLVAAATTAQRKLGVLPVAGKNVWTSVGWAPQVDGRIVPADPYDPAHPLMVDVPLMVGSTRHEFDMAVRFPAMLQMDEAALKAALAKTYGPRGEALYAGFRPAYPTLEPVHLLAVISAMAFNRVNAVEQAQAKAAQGGRAWLYEFAWETPVLDGHPKAFHGADLPFVFANTELCDETTGGGLRPRALAERMARAWVAFARGGDPGWTPVTARTAPTMVFDDTPILHADLDGRLRALVAGL